jgi:predicted anti-sigma-YlaC factor YlaD
MRLLTILGMVAVSTLIMIEPAAAADRLLNTQGEYIANTATLWESAMKGILFIMGIAAVGFSGWHMLQDYVFAKADHEKKFSIGKLIVGAMIGSLLCAPYGAMVIGGDITGAGQKVQSLSDDDFERRPGG